VLTSFTAGVTRANAEPSTLVPEIGYNYGEIETPRATAVGGAQRALSNSLTALFTNPANMIATRIYHVGAFAQFWPEADRWTYGAAAVDSIVSSLNLAGGIGGTWNIQDSDGVDRQYTDLRFGVALPATDALLLGLGGRFLWLSQNGRGPFGASLASGGLRDERIVKHFALDAGVTVKPSEELALSIVGNNLNKPDHGFQPTSVGGGIGYGTDKFALEADVLADFTSWEETTMRAMAGGELLLGDSVPIRAGYRFDQGADSHALSLGVGYIDRSFAFEIAGRRVLAGDIATAITVGFTFHVESTGMTPSPSDTF
jgi:opacity protein-like surface antigen